MDKSLNNWAGKEGRGKHVRHKGSAWRMTALHLHLLNNKLRDSSIQVFLRFNLRIKPTEYAVYGQLQSPSTARQARDWGKQN